MAMAEPRDTQEFSSQLEMARIEAEVVQARIDALHEELAENVHPGGPLEQEFEAQMARRKELLLALGQALFMWVREGGDIQLIPPEAEEDIPEADQANVVSLPVPKLDPRPPMPPSDPVIAEILTELEADEPAPKPKPLPEPPPKPVKKASPQLQASLDALANRGLEPRWDKPRAKQDAWKVTLKKLMDDFGGVQKVTSNRAFTDAVSRVIRVVDQDAEWESVPRGSQKALLGLCAAYTRYLHDDASQDFRQATMDVYLGNMFSKMTQFSESQRPGFVQGLSRHHRPDGRSWLDDANVWWTRLNNDLSRGDTDPAKETNPERTLANLDAILDEDPSDKEICQAAVVCLNAGVSPDDKRLVKMLVPHLASLTSARALKRTRKAIRVAVEEEEAEEESSDTANPIPKDWPFFKTTRGKTALIVGGDKRDKTVRRMKEAFEFGEVAWDSGWSTRRISALAKQVKSGNVDLVIFLARFLSHSSWDILVPACKIAGIQYHLVESGYGVNQIRMTLEGTNRN